MSNENGKEKKPFSVKEFFKSTSFKCIAVLLAIVLVCGILLTICNSLFKVTDHRNSPSGYLNSTLLENTHRKTSNINKDNLTC